MTDNEIIKALECCDSYFDCDGCPCEDVCGGLSDLSANVLDLLNRQKAEIERKHKIVCDYAQAARIIELYLKDFCDKKLPYDEMIADASRKASAEIESLEKKARLKNAEVIHYKSLYENNNSETTKSLASVIKDKTAELERYKGVIKILENNVKTAKSEAIKEFAERLKEKFIHKGKSTKYGEFTWDDVTSYELDKLVKEMTERKE